MRTFFSDRLVTLNKLIGAVGLDVSMTSSTLESPFVEPLDATGRPAYRALRAASRQDREAVKSLAVLKHSSATPMISQSQSASTSSTRDPHVPTFHVLLAFA
jgi:hypothetical protein